MKRYFWVFGIFLVFFTVLISIIFFDQQKSQRLISPILQFSKISIADNVWFPKKSNFVYAKDQNAPHLTAKSAFFVDTQTGEVLYEKNPNEKLSAASLVKIMTVIVSLDHKDFKDTLKVSDRAASTEPDKMLLVFGEKLTIEELLDGIFLVSANDGAEVLAEGSVGSREEFIKLMNNKALQLGMVNTHFLNPTGLEEDNQQQYSTAYDIAIMARYAIRKWPHLVDISSLAHIVLPQTQTHQDYDLYSGINLLTTYPGVVGFKTGFTPEAGLTLVTLARRQGHEVLGVILGATDRRDDAKVLLDYSFKNLGVKVN